MHTSVSLVMNCMCCDGWVYIRLHKYREWRLLALALVHALVLAWAILPRKNLFDRMGEKLFSTKITHYMIRIIKFHVICQFAHFEIMLQNFKPCNNI